MTVGASSFVLVDTSVWIKFFRFLNSHETEHLDFLLQSGAVRICDPVRAEVLSGARNDSERRRLRDLFDAVPLVQAPPNIWEQVEDIRYTLARKGHSTSLIDLWIACTAAFHGYALWTLDSDFTAVRTILPLSLYSF